MFVDSSNPDRLITFGYVFIALLAGLFIVNWTVILPHKLIDLLKIIREYRHKKKKTSQDKDVTKTVIKIQSSKIPKHPKLFEETKRIHSEVEFTYSNNSAFYSPGTIDRTVIKKIERRAEPKKLASFAKVLDTISEAS